MVPSAAVGKLIDWADEMVLFWQVAEMVGTSSMARRIGLEMPEGVATRRARNCSLIPFGKVNWQVELLENLASRGMDDQRESGSFNPVPKKVIWPPLKEMAAGEE